MFKLRKSSLVIVPLVASLGLTACFGAYRHDLIPAEISTHMKGYEHRAENMREALQKTNLLFDINRFVDRRKPSSYSTFEPNIVMHTYDPDRLPGNAPGYIRAVMGEAFDVNRDIQNPEPREVFFDLRDVDMRILNGDFISGRFGRYYVRIEADVKVRNGQGTVLVDKPYETELEIIRQSFTGGHPTEEQDWHNMVRTVQLAVRNMTVELMDDTLAGDNKVVKGSEVTETPVRYSSGAFSE